MDEFKSNSDKSREEKKAVEPKKPKPVLSQKPKQIKKQKKMTDILDTDDVNSVASYVWKDVVIPNVKKLLYEMVTKGMSMLLHVDEKPKASSSKTNVSYSKYYDKDDDRRNSAMVTRKAGFDYDDILYQTANDAESVLDTLYAILEQYDVVSVADLYEQSDLPNDNYMANRYGWESLKGTRVMRVRDGYVLTLPKARPL